MSKTRKSLKKPRQEAFNQQQGNCYYCGQPMWLNNNSEFALKHQINLSQTYRFMCTGEHLTAHKDGGSSKQYNIVAACWYCNQQRHRRKTEPTHQQYKQFVESRMSKGRWHRLRLCNN